LRWIGATAKKHGGSKVKKRHRNYAVHFRQDTCRLLKGWLA